MSKDGLRNTKSTVPVVSGRNLGESKTGRSSKSGSDAESELTRFGRFLESTRGPVATTTRSGADPYGRSLGRVASGAASGGAGVSGGGGFFADILRRIEAERGASDLRAKGSGIFDVLNQAGGAPLRSQWQDLLESFGRGDDLESQIAQAIGASRVSAPSLDTFMAPYLQAETAANKAYEAALPVIDNAQKQAATSIGATGQEFQSDLATTTQQDAAARNILNEQLSADMQGSVLADQLGLTPGLEAQASLQDALLAAANQSADNLGSQIVSGAKADSQNVLETSISQAAAAKSGASTNLQRLLGQIGLGKAKAEQDYTLAANAATRENAQMESQIRREFTQAREQQQADRMQQFELLKSTAAPAWEGVRAQNEARFPKATALFDQFVGEVMPQGRTPADYREAKRRLDTMITNLSQPEINESTGQVVRPAQKLDARILNEWLDQTFYGEPVPDMRAFILAGGDPSILGGGSF